MFTRLAKSGLVDFRLVQSRRAAPGLRGAFTPCNDNLSELRHPVLTDKRRSQRPALTCRWFDRGGRLECRWQVGTGEEAPIADDGILSVDLRVSLSVKEKRRSSR